MAVIRDAIEETLLQLNPMTCRQLFYQLVVQGVIAKTQNEYKSTVIRLLEEMRRSGRIPFSWIVDNSRWMRKPSSYESLTDMLEQSQRFYRRDKWNGQGVYVEIWCESNAIAGVLYEATSEWDVPLMVSKGFSSITFLHSAAESIQYEDKPAYLYYFGDHDPSGIDIDRKILSDLHEFAPDADITFERVAVIPEQIEKWNLPSQPPKKTDSRIRSFKGEAVELDSIPPKELIAIADRCIKQHIDFDEYNRMVIAETAEQVTLETIIGNLGGAA